MWYLLPDLFLLSVSMLILVQNTFYKIYQLEYWTWTWESS